MYVPPLDSILRALGTTRTNYERSDTVTVPKGLFEFLIRVALANGEFNEGGYLRANPDVANAMAKGTTEGPRKHYVNYGYFEGRTGAMPTVNERWYLTTYSDVAQAVKLGQVHSANDHFNDIGAAEGRSPSPDYIAVAEQWKKALSKG